jgi:hypothetical protein
MLRTTFQDSVGGTCPNRVRNDDVSIDVVEFLARIKMSFCTARNHGIPSPCEQLKRVKDGLTCASAG